MYQPEFYNDINTPALVSAEIILAELFFMSGIVPDSIIDIGCGEGAWLKVAKEKFGIKEIYGLDGSYIQKDRLLIDENEFDHIDLNDPSWSDYRISSKKYSPSPWDLVISLEVAEHISESSADYFIESLCRFGDRVLFSAAIPGQNGLGHVNEQWPSYWVEKFEKNGFYTDDLLRWIIWNDKDVATWYKQNIFLFVKGGGKGKVVPDVVHPENWKAHYLDKL
jgi:hypothetical protein